MKVLLIEDDSLLGESVKEFMNRHGIFVDWIQDDRKLQYLDFDRYDVVVLDLMLKFYRG